MTIEDSLLGINSCLTPTLAVFQLYIVAVSQTNLEVYLLFIIENLTMTTIKPLFLNFRFFPRIGWISFMYIWILFKNQVAEPWKYGNKSDTCQYYNVTIHHISIMGNCWWIRKRTVTLTKLINYEKLGMSHKCKLIWNEDQIKKSNKCM